MLKLTQPSELELTINSAAKIRTELSTLVRKSPLT
jgi:hypothetical protein